MPDTRHSPLPWRQSVARPHELHDVTGEPVLRLAQSVPGRDLANMDLAERSINGYEPLLASVRLALGLLDRAARHGATPDDVLQALGVLRRAAEERAVAGQSAG